MSSTGMAEAVPAATRPRPARTSGASRQTERAYGELRRLLYLQRIPDGQRIRELEWTRRLGVSRSALREAMARLEAEGLLVKLPLAGYAAPDMNAGDWEDACEMRLLLEIGAVERICRYRLNTPAAMRLLRRASEQFEELALQGYQYGVVEADWRFHETLVGMAGNKRLTTIFRRGSIPFALPDLLEGHAFAVSLQSIVDDHRAVIEGLQQADITGVTAALQHHLLRPRPDSADRLQT